MTTFEQTRARMRVWRSRLRQANIGALEVFLRVVPSERNRMFALTIILGVLCGFAAVAFHLAIKAAEGLLIERAMDAAGSSWMFWTIVTPTLGGLACGFLLTRVVPDARGSGIPQVKVAYEIKGGRLPLRVTVGKFLIGVLQIGSGASLGREGPTVQICAGIASALGRTAALPRQSLRRLLPIGAAAGIAAAFNAPIAAVMFTIEELVGDIDQTILYGVVVASALAAAIERSVLGTHPVFEITQVYSVENPWSLLLYALLGVAAAVVAVVFSEALLTLRAWFQRTSIPAWMRPGVGGLVTGVLAVAALLLVQSRGVTGGGYDVLAEALEGKLALQALLVLGVLKLIATVFSYSSGGAGGLFAPALFIGGMLGGAFGVVDKFVFNQPDVQIGAFALVGMGAVFAGFIRAPITSVLIIFEMTGAYTLILPLMVANMTAYAVARRIRPLAVYDALLEQDGVQMPHGKGPLTHALERVRVAQAMTKETVSLPGTMLVSEAISHVEPYAFSSFPVIDEQDRCVGLVSESLLRRTVAEGNGEQSLQAVTNRRQVVTPDQRLVQAVVAMNKIETRQIAVVNNRNDRQLVGILTMSDIVRAQAQAALGSDATEASDFSEVSETLAA